MKVLTSMIVLLTLGSCAHHDVGVEHHHHTCEENCSVEHNEADAFNRHCAHSVAIGELTVMGKEEYMVNHKGKDYYFSSKKNMETFKQNIQDELSKANHNWSAGQFR